MKHLQTFLVFLMSLAIVYGQVGINHDGSDPAAGTILHVKSQASVKPDVVVQDATGYVGLGTLNPQDRLDLWGGARMSLDANNYIRIHATPTTILGNPAMEGFAKLEGNAFQRFVFVANNGSGYDTIMSLFRPTTSVGIGTNFPQGKVHVRVTDLDVDRKISSMGMEYNDFDSWTGIALLKDTINNTGVHPFIGYGKEDRFFTIIQFADTNRTVAYETRMIFHPSGYTGIGDPNTHAFPDAALTVSNGPIWHVTGTRAPILRLKDYDGTLRLEVDADGNLTLETGDLYLTGGGVMAGGDIVSDADVSGNTVSANDITANQYVYVGDNIQLEGPTGNGTFLGNLDIAGTINVGTEVNRADQASADLIPYAYGVIDNATISGDTENMLVDHPSVGVYLIAFNDDYNQNDYVVLITPQSTAPVYATTSQNGTDLQVNLFDRNGSPVDARFQILVYRK